MAPPPFGAKVVTTVVFGALGAGVFAGVSHDGRGAEPVDAVVEESPPTTVPSTVGSTSLVPPSTTITASTIAGATSTAITTIAPAEPAVPDTSRARARVRSGAS
jgi:hypothetical protein